MNNFGKLCIELRKKDLTIMEIGRITGKGKSTIYPYIKDIPLSDRHIERIRKLHAERIRQYPLQRKGKSLKVFKKFTHWNIRHVRLVAHLIFDGEIKPAGCAYNNRNIVLLKRVEKLMRDLYGFPPVRYYNKLTGVSRISYYNVALGIYMKEKSLELLSEVCDLPKNLKRAFLQAFFDDEGCMDFRPSKKIRRIRGYQKNIAVLKLISGLLADFDIQSRFQKPNEVVIIGLQNLIKFQKEIGFSFGVKINGNRTNSIWKKHLEKRVLLHRAIKSFSKA